MKLSIVATLYQSAPYIRDFHRRATAVAREVVGDDYEIVLVNDGSPDDSLSIAIELTKCDRHLVVVDLSRNFGHHRAIMTGLGQAKGRFVFLIDSDLEEQPEWLVPFAEEMNAQECDVVYGVQGKRRGGLVERWSGYCFYKVLNLLSGLSLPENMVTARLMTRRYVESLLLHEERELDIGGLWYITGYSQRPHAVKKLSTSPTTYTLYRKILLTVNSVTSFSSTPLQMIFYLGIGISLAGTLYAAWVIIQRLRLSEPLPGWASLIASIWLLSGFIILSVGTVGIYLSKVFAEVKRRPYSIIRDVHGREGSDRPEPERLLQKGGSPDGSRPDPG